MHAIGSYRDGHNSAASFAMVAHIPSIPGQLFRQNLKSVLTDMISITKVWEIKFTANDIEGISFKIRHIDC
jgi:hypothetical protein